VIKEENIDPKRFEPRAILNAISAAKNECIAADDYAGQMIFC